MKIGGPESIQGSDEWKIWRRSKISATDICTIVGVNPYCTPLTLWKRKLGLIPEQETNAHMARGANLEPKVRELANNRTGIDFFPTVCVHDTYEWASASLDGLSYCGEYALEVKCPAKLDTRLPDQYRPQVQWILMVSGAKRLYFYSYCNGETFVSYEVPDPAYQNELLIKAIEFKRCLDERIEPSLTRAEERKMGGLVDRNDDFELTHLIFEHEAAKKEAKHFKELEEDLKAKIVEKVRGYETMCAGAKILKIVTQGRVDYDSIPQLKGVNLDSFRKPSTENWRISR